MRNVQPSLARGGPARERRVVVVGAGYAGLSCALRLARQARGRARVILINADEHFVERIRLHEQAVGAQPRELPLVQLVRGSAVELRIGRVESIDVGARTLALGGENLAWDQLVLALGSRVAIDSVPGVRELAYTLEGESVDRLAAALPGLAERGARVVVVGGGLTGIEAASELAEAYPRLSVALVTRGELAPGFSERARERMRQSLLRLGVELREQHTVRALRPTQLLTERGPIDHAACVWASGFTASPLARSAGLAVDDHGRVWVDAELRSISHPAVHVAGDLAVHGAQAERPIPMGCKSAFPTGMHVADNLARQLAGQPEQPFSYVAVPFCVSLGRRDAVVELPQRGAQRSRKLVAGWLAVQIKNLIVRGTLWTLALERQRAALANLFRPRPRLLASSKRPDDLTDGARV